MSTPTVQRIFALRQKLVTLIDGGNPGDRPTLVVENLVGDVRRNPKTRHAGHTRSPQIVKAPARHAREFVELAFGGAEVLKGLFAREGKGELPRPRHAQEQSNDLMRQVHDMRLAVFGAGPWKGPGLTGKV